MVILSNNPRIEKIVKECLEYRGYSSSEAASFVRALRGSSDLKENFNDCSELTGFCLLANISETENNKKCFILNNPLDKGDPLGVWSDIYYHDGMFMIEGKHTKVFDSYEKAHQFAELWKRHPWWPTNYRAYKIVKIIAEVATYKSYKLIEIET